MQPQEADQTGIDDKYKLKRTNDLGVNDHLYKNDDLPTGPKILRNLEEYEKLLYDE